MTMYEVDGMDPKLVPIANELMRRAAVCAKVTVPDLRSRRKSKPIVSARAACMYLMRELGMQGGQIAAILCQDFRTVSRVTKAFRELLEKREEDAVYALSYLLREDGDLLGHTSDIVMVRIIREENANLKLEVEKAQGEAKRARDEAQVLKRRLRDAQARLEWVKGRISKVFEDSKTAKMHNHGGVM